MKPTAARSAFFQAFAANLDRFEAAAPGAVRSGLRDKALRLLQSLQGDERSDALDLLEAAGISVVAAPTVPHGSGGPSPAPAPAEGEVVTRLAALEARVAALEEALQ